MMYSHLTDEELVALTYAKTMTELEMELVSRLETVMWDDPEEPKER